MEQKNESDTFVKQFFFIFSPSFTLKTYYKKTHTRFEQLFQKHFFPFWIYISKRMNKTSPSFPEISKPSNIWFVLFNSQTIMVIDILTTINSRHLWFIPVWDWNVCLCIYTHTYTHIHIYTHFYLCLIYHFDLFNWFASFARLSCIRKKFHYFFVLFLERKKESYLR